MRKQIAAANWKMNLTYQEAETLLDEILINQTNLEQHQQVILAVPFPYITLAQRKMDAINGYEVAAQNCYNKSNGAFTGEVSVEMLQSLNIKYCIIGHSERREYFIESNAVLAQKIDLCLQHDIIPIFCCGEALTIREEGRQNDYVQTQLEESIFHLTADVIKKIIIAYEPIWAIGTGKTATAEQAQQMHAHIRSVLAEKYGEEAADTIPILYGGSVKSSNAKELFSNKDVDGGLVGGASLVAQDFIEIIKSLKNSSRS